MKITNVRAVGLECPIKDWMLPSRTYVLVEVETDEGITGIGQSSTVGHPEVGMMIEKRIKPLLVGEDPFDRSKLRDKIFYSPRAILSWGHKGAESHAYSGVDIALWDIAGKACNRPVHKLLGGYREKIRAYLSLGNPDKIEEYLAQGFTAFKFSLGKFDEARPLSVKEVDNLAKKVRKAVGDEIDLMFDGHQMFSVAAAIKIAKVLENYDAYFFEQPILAYDTDGQATLAAHTTVPLAEGEKVCGLREAADLINNGRIQYIQPEIPNCGGISEAIKIAALAESRGRIFCPHCGDSPVDLASMLQVVGAIPNAVFIEWQSEWLDYPMRWELLRNPLKLDSKGYIEIPKGPGLGIVLDEKAVKKYHWKMF